MKKGTKLLTAGLLVVTTVATGCSTPSTSPGAGSAGPQNTGTLAGANFLPEEGAVLRVSESNEARATGYAQVLADKFEEEYAEYNITVEVVPNDGFQLEIDGPAGKAPDVFQMAADRTSWYAGQLVMPIDPALKAMDNGDIPEFGWESGMYEGTEYVYPMTIQTSIMMYRKSMIPTEWQDENGELDVESWNDLYAMNRAIKDGEYADESTLTHGIMYDLDNVYASYGIFESYGAFIFNEDETAAGFHEGEGYKAGKVLRDLSETMYDMQINWETINQIPAEMARGNYLGTINTPNQAVNIVTQLVNQGVYGTEEEAEADLGYMILPVLPADGDIKTPLEEGEATIETKVMGGTTGMMISSFTPYPNAARLYAAYAAQPENVLERCEYTSLTPIRISSLEHMTEAAQVTFEQSQEGRFSLTPQTTAMGQVWGPANSVFGKFINDHYDDSVDFSTDEAIQAELEKLSTDIMAAITALDN